MSYSNYSNYSNYSHFLFSSPSPALGPPSVRTTRQSPLAIEMVDNTSNSPPLPPARPITRRPVPRSSVAVPEATLALRPSTPSTSTTTVSRAMSPPSQSPAEPPPAYTPSGRGQDEHTMTVEARRAYETAFNTAYNAIYSTTSIPSWPRDSTVVSDREVQISRPGTPPPAYNFGARASLSRQSAVRPYSPPPAYTSDPHAPSLQVRQASASSRTSRGRPVDYVWDWDPIRQRAQYIPRIDSVERDYEARALIMGTRASTRPGAFTNNPNPGSRSSWSTVSASTLENGLTQNEILDRELGRTSSEERARDRRCGWFWCIFILVILVVGGVVGKYGHGGSHETGASANATTTGVATPTTTATATGADTASTTMTSTMTTSLFSLPTGLGLPTRL